MYKHTVAIVSGVSLLLLLIAVASSRWAKNEQGNVTLTWGLWQSCSKMSGQKATCLDLPPKSDDKFPKHALTTVQALSILALVALAVSLAMCVQNPNDKNGAILCIIAGVMILLAIAVWNKKLKTINSSGAPVKGKYDIAYWLALIGGLVALVGGIVAVVNHGKMGSSGRNSPRSGRVSPSRR